jgi:hypothetical protein
MINILNSKLFIGFAVTYSVVWMDTATSTYNIKGILPCPAYP